MALLVRAEEFSSEASKSLASTTPTQQTVSLRLDISSSHLKELQIQVQRTLLYTRALVELHNHSHNSAIAAQKNLITAAPVIETLSEYPGSGEVELTKLIDWPPKLKPVPAKPLFFDSAWNYISYPGKASTVAPAVQQAVNGAQEEQQPAARGWFGFGRR